MKSGLAEKQSPATSNVIEELQKFLSADLAGVNAEIVKRMHSPVALIPQLAAHIVAAGGKRLRPLLTLASAQLCGYRGEHHIPLAAAVEFIHTATLLHDDVVDESKKRRGMDTANEIWGNKPSVLVGDFLFSRSFQLMVESDSLTVLKILADASAIIAEGEVHQLLTANNLETSEDDYYRVITAKTASLFAAACEIGAVIANRPDGGTKALYDYGLNLGLAFQISDDVYDYSGLPGKQAGDDFRDGKVTLPLILACKNASAEEREFWKKCIERQEIAEADFARAVGLLNKHQSLQQSLQTAQNHAGLAKQHLDLFLNSPLKNLLLQIADYAATR